MTSTFFILWLAASAAITSEPSTTHQDIQLCLNSASTKPFDDEACLALIAAQGEPIGTEAKLHSQELARVNSTLAAGYAAKGDLVVGDQYLEQAVTLAPQDWHTLANVGVVHLYNTRFSQALDTLDRAMRLNPDFPPYLLLNRSLALRGLGRFPESARDLEDYAYLTGQNMPLEVACDPTTEGCIPAPAAGPHQSQ